MPDPDGGGLSGLLHKLLHRTEAVVVDQEVVFVRGKVVGRTVTDASGAPIIEAGHRVDEPVIQRAVAAGRLHALVGAVAAAQGQDLQEKAQEIAGHTPEGRENRALDSTADYGEARRYVGQLAGLDVTDIRGNVIVPAGKEITEDDVRAARQAGLLSALIYSAKQPASARSASHQSAAPEAQPGKRATLPVLGPSDKDDTPSGGA